MTQNVLLKHIKTSKEMQDFIAIDFETANGYRSSVCSVGIVMVKNGEVVDNFYSLIHPEPNYYAWFCQEVHGLGYEDTDDAPNFKDVWSQVEEKIKAVYGKESGEMTFVAHNAPFDSSCLKAVFKVYQMTYPDFTFKDTLCPSRQCFKSLPNHQLQTVSAVCGYDLTQHHNALADAEACAAIALRVL